MRFAHLGIILTVLLSLVLCIRQLGEPDVWWQIRTGEYILEHGAVPKTDVFSYTYAGDPWFNVKWGTEVIMAGVAKWFGPESLMLLHWAVLLTILWFIYLSFIQLNILLKVKIQKPGSGFFIALGLFLLAMSYRINARPEMMSHLLSAVYIYLFLRYHNHQDKLIYLLIPLQLIWGNLHEAFGVGQVLILIFILTAWFRYLFSKKNPVSLPQLRVLSLLCLIALLSVVVHPMGMGMLTKPFDIFGQLGANKFTTELWSFKHSEFWNLAAYLGLAFSIVLALQLGKKKGGKLYMNNLPLSYLMILLAFFYLASSANRNLPFFFIASAPLLAVIFNRLLSDKTYATYLYIALSISFYVSVATGSFYKRFYPVEKFGLSVDHLSTPIGAAEFIKDNGLSGNSYVDYFSSSYFLYELKPEYKSYLDLRDLDVFEAQFITNNLLNYTRPTTPTKSGKPLFRFMEELDDFNYVVMENNPQFITFHKYMNGLEDYVLAYADPLSSIYIKDKPENDHLITKYKDLELEEKFHAHSILEPKPIWRLLTQFVAPWYKPEDPTAHQGEYLATYQLQYLN